MNVSCISCWKSFWSSSASRCNCFCLSSMFLARLCAFRIIQCGALGLELLLQRVDLIVQCLELLALGLVLRLQVSEVALKFVGLGYGLLEGDYGDLRGTGRSSGSAVFERRAAMGKQESSAATSTVERLHLNECSFFFDFTSDRAVAAVSRKLCLEGRRDGQAEGLARLAEQVLRSVGLDRLPGRCSRPRRPAGTCRA